MSIFGLHPVYSYLLLAIVFIVLFFLLPSFIIHPVLRKNIKKDEYIEDSNFLLLTSKQEKAFEYISFNNKDKKQVVNLKLKENIDKADITVVYTLNNKNEIKNYTLKVGKDKKRVFDVNLSSNASLHSVILNSYNKTRLESVCLYSLAEPSVTLLTIMQCIFIGLASISILLCIKEIALFNDLYDDYLFSMEIFGMTIADSGLLIIVLLVSLVLIFPTLNQMNKSLYRKELYGGWLND